MTFWFLKLSGLLLPLSCHGMQSNVAQSDGTVLHATSAYNIFATLHETEYMLVLFSQRYILLQTVKIR